MSTKSRCPGEDDNNSCLYYEHCLKIAKKCMGTQTIMRKLGVCYQYKRRER